MLCYVTAPTSIGSTHIALHLITPKLGDFSVRSQLASDVRHTHAISRAS